MVACAAENVLFELKFIEIHIDLNQGSNFHDFVNLNLSISISIQIKEAILMILLGIKYKDGGLCSRKCLPHWL